MALRPQISTTRRFGNKLQSAPAAEPVTLAEAKAHMRITDDDSNDYITDLIPQAREILEQIAGIAFITQTWQLTLDGWPGYDEEPWWNGTRTGSINELYGGLMAIELPRYPLQSVDSVTTYDRASNATSIVVADTFDVDTKSRRGRLVLKEGQVWPAALRRTNGVQVDYIAGYGDAASDVPTPLKRAVLVLIMYLFEHRGNCGANDAYNKSGASEILRLYRDMSV